MFFSFKLRSHVAQGQSFLDGQLLVDHLKGVAEIALQTNAMHGMKGDVEEAIKIICMCHDFGKASGYFQKYLKGEYHGDLKNHGEISAYFAYYMLPEKWKLMGFLCVKKHHGDMEPDRLFFDYDKESLIKISASIAKAKEELSLIYGKNIEEFFDIIQQEDFLKAPWKSFRKKMKQFTTEDFVWLQYLWSLLLTGDKSQLIRGTAYINKTDVNEKYIQKYKAEVREELMEKFPGIEQTQLFSIRNQIYEEIIESIDQMNIEKEHIFSINVPTGTGKTLGVYGAALKLAERLYAQSKGTIYPTIVYNIPFTSVIDQNYKVLEEIMQYNDQKDFESLILKHHSMTELQYRDNEAKEYRNYDARFCVENWQSTIITTTFVQLFNTIFQAGTNAIIHRFHRLAGSIIILDEVQAIPPKYFKIIEEVFDVLCRQFHCYVIVVTATKPLFLRGKELVPSNQEIFGKMDRICIENHIDTPIHLEEFCQIILEDIKKSQNKSFLIVLNTIKSSLQVVDYLKEAEEAGAINREILYLSTEIHPAKRLEIINMVKDNKNTKYVLVSTQLIEAGVDFDFDIIYRDFSTLDSINQTSGRANRNAVHGKGFVKLYALMDDKNKDKLFSKYIYPESLLHATECILKDRKVIEERNMMSLNDQYFIAVNQVKSDDDSNEIMKAIADFNFVNIKKLFKLIDKDYTREDIIINYNDETQTCLEIVQSEDVEYQEMINAWRRLSKYKVSVPRKDLDRINCVTIKGINILDKKNYDENRGIRRTKSVMF